eukprot:5846560-Amphidinium_carterae.1
MEQLGTGCPHPKLWNDDLGWADIDPKGGLLMNGFVNASKFNARKVLLMGAFSYTLLVRILSLQRAVFAQYFALSEPVRFYVWDVSLCRGFCGQKDFGVAGGNFVKGGLITSRVSTHFFTKGPLAQHKTGASLCKGASHSTAGVWFVERGFLTRSCLSNQNEHVEGGGVLFTRALLHNTALCCKGFLFLCEGCLLVKGFFWGFGGFLMVTVGPVDQLGDGSCGFDRCCEGRSPTPLRPLGGTGLLFIA